STHSPTPHIYTLSLHDALPISRGFLLNPKAAIPSGLRPQEGENHAPPFQRMRSSAAMSSFRRASIANDARATTSYRAEIPAADRDRKSTRLNSSHVSISYAVFC